MKQVYKVSFEFGIAANTAKRYLRSLQDYGLCFESNRGIEVVSLKSCIMCLFGVSGRDYKAFAAVRFFNDYNSAKTVKEFQELIEIGLLRRSLGQQEFNYNKIKSIHDFLTNKSVTKGRAKMHKIRKMASNLGLTLDEFIDYISRLVRKNIRNTITGRFHLSNKVGFSSSTGSKRLRVWNNKRYINRKVVYTDTSLPIHSMNRRLLLDECGYTHLLECKKRNTYIVTLGSAVSINELYLNKQYATL